MSTQLRSPQTAADLIGVSVKTLNGYINVRHGTKKLRRKFTDEDLEEFIQRRAQSDVPCRSISTKTARSTTSTSNFEGDQFHGSPASSHPTPDASSSSKRDLVAALFMISLRTE
jgi:hypothetical protein